MSDAAIPDNQGTPTGIAAAARRNRTTRKSVLIADKTADWAISVGGIFVILAVFGIMAFLAEVVVPLFMGGSVDASDEIRLPATSGDVLFTRMDEYRSLVVQVKSTGDVVVSHTLSGERLVAPAYDFQGKTVTSSAVTLSGDNVIFGFDDGTVRFARLNLQVSVITPDQLPANARKLNNADSTDGTSLYSAIPGHQIRRISLKPELDEPQQISDQPIDAVDYRVGGTVERPTRSFVTVDRAGAVKLSRTESRINMLTRKATVSTATSVLPSLPSGTRVLDILMTDKADQVYIADKSGQIFRYDARDFNKPVLAETVDVTEGNVELKVFAFLIGEQSIIAGGSDGSVNIYFRLENRQTGGTDGYKMTRAHKLEPHKAEVVAVSQSQRGKSFATADAEGNVWIRHATSDQTLVKTSLGAKPASISLSPRDDGLLALAGDKGMLWHVRIPHPETTWASIFGKVWYEGYPEPTYTWQSSSGTDSFEPKFSLVPLIFGTIKATVYTMLFAVPLALLAAIYTSEFVHKSVRATVKPVMEMMASLPSVVLGFIAALILAPFVEVWISAVLLAFLIVPLSLLFAAYAWQMIPRHIALKLDGLPKLFLMFAVIILGLWLTVELSSTFEEIFFAGDVRQWANGSIGTGVAFLALLLFPVSLVAIIFLLRRYGGAQLDAIFTPQSQARAGIVDLLRGVIQLILAGLVSYLVALSLTWIGFDVRGGVIGTYVQRNTLIVSFAMGFAVIPIIYTIAEDAMNAVPEHLRAASLACGATPWQTAISVILPTAMSGVFAAMMIGMGRAVGETMIVVMAAGNTPILDWNIFNGLRALSANIAVELPEAVRDDSLYRMLFLAALTLFVMTFIVNTLAEIIRQRFRKRAAQL